MEDDAPRARRARAAAGRAARRAVPSRADARRQVAGRSLAGWRVGVDARALVRAREQPAEVAPSARVADEQREVTGARRLGPRRRGRARGRMGGGTARWAIDHRHLRAVDGPQAQRLGRLGELHGTDNESWSVSASASCPRCTAAATSLGQRGAVEEGEGEWQ